ncbi:MAG TPA: hypothetical protein VM388_12855 [Acidimicrobiales bacterium]|nr:hypothetical protein [Acidimicrobiales bacterium]
MLIEEHHIFENLLLSYALVEQGDKQADRSQCLVPPRCHGDAEMRLCAGGTTIGISQTVRGSP